MTQYFGDFSEDDTVYIPFNTFSSDDPSASVTITNLADADIKVHKDGSTTQIVTDGATVAIDFDSITGNHLVTVDTSAHADYSTGSDYLVRIEGTTVDGATVNAWVGSFSIENRYSAGALRPTTAGRTLDVTANGEAGIDLSNASGALDNTHVGWVDANDRVDVGSVLGTAQTAGDIPALVTTVDTVADGIQTDLSNATDGLGALKALIDTLTTNVGTVDTVVDGIQTDLDNGTDGLGALKALIDTVDTVVDAIKVVTDAQAATGTGLTAVPWNAAWDAEVQSEVNDALVALGLDHLVAASVAGTDVVDNSIIAKLVSASATADFDDFVNTTDSLQAVRDKQTDIETDTQDLQTQIGTAGAGLTDLGDMSTTMTASVLAEINTALDTAISELGVAAPTATPTLRTGLMLLYMMARNKLVVQTSGTDAIEVYNDAGTKIAAKTITDDGSDYTEDEMA